MDKSDSYYFIFQMKTDGPVYAIRSEVVPDLDTVYRLTGCSCVETVPLWDNYMLVVDESGWLKDEPHVNVKASLLYSGTPDSIAGDALILKRVRYDWHALTLTECDMLLKKIIKTLNEYIQKLEVEI